MVKVFINVIDYFGMQIITTTYKGPDLDGYGCSFAYAEFLRSQGKDAEVHIWGTPHVEVQWLIKTFKLSCAQGSTDDTTADVVLLDASNPDILPSPLKPEQVTEIIDHRKIHAADQFPNAKVQIELVGAAATLVAGRFKQAGIEPSKESAMFLYGGILSNTHNFTGLTTDRDREMAGWLKHMAEAPDDLAHQMFLAKSDLSGSRLRDTLFGDLKTLHLNGTSVTIAQLEIIGVDDLLAKRNDEIKTILSEIQNHEKAEYTFLNMIDLDTSISKILCLDAKTKDLLKELPDSVWNDLLGTSPTFTLRKQLSIWILDRLRGGGE